MALEEKITKLISPILKDMGLVLYELKYEKEDGENYLRIFLERENDDVMDLDTCVEVSEKISLLLDKEDPIPNEYYLEVASSGREKCFNDKQDYLKNIDKYILVDTSELVNGYDELVGYLKDVSDEGIKLEINLKGRIKIVDIPFKIIEKAHLTYKI
jgi:ribosome maturation factor RimP